MPHLSGEFRDFDLLPPGLGPAPEQIRCCLPRHYIITHYICAGLIAAAGASLAVTSVIFLSVPNNVLGSFAILAASGLLIYRMTYRDYRWIELQGQVLRGQTFFTGRIVERRLDEIRCLEAALHPGRGTESFFTEGLLGRVRGFKIRFYDERTPMNVGRFNPAMTNGLELMQAMVQRMREARSVDAKIVLFKQAPLVQQIHWQGEAPATDHRNLLMTAIAVLIPIGLFFGPLLSGVAIQHGRLRELWQVPPQPISLEELVRNGPGTNPHVVLTNFRFGGNVTEGPRDNPDRFENVWIALLQTPDVPDAKMTKPEIKAVLHSKSIRNDRDLRKYLNAGRVDGICADTPTQYGAQLRKKMIDANPRASLLAVYVIQDMTEPPSADSIWAAHWGAAACLTAVLLAAVIVFLLL